MSDEKLSKRVLLVEDDDTLALTLSRFLEKHGFDTNRESRGDIAATRILTLQPDVVILDGHLPGKDGFEICREIRHQFNGAIIILTARTDDMDQVVGLELGADDYIAKPAAPRVVLARIRNCLRRMEARDKAREEPTELRFGRFHMDRATRTVFLDSHEVSMTAAEFDLLWMLASRAGAVVTRDEVQKALRGLEFDGLDRSIDMRISRLRKRLGDDTVSPRRIKTIRAKGYLFSPKDWE